MRRKVCTPRARPRVTVLLYVSAGNYSPPVVACFCRARRKKYQACHSSKVCALAVMQGRQGGKACLLCGKWRGCRALCCRKASFRSGYEFYRGSSLIARWGFQSSALSLAMADLHLAASFFLAASAVVDRDPPPPSMETLRLASVSSSKATSAAMSALGRDGGCGGGGGGGSSCSAAASSAWAGFV